MGDDGWTKRRDDPTAHWNRPTKPKAKKDRAHWCRGKEGVEHDWVFEIPVNAYRQTCSTFRWGNPLRAPHWNCAHQWLCARCGRLTHSRRNPKHAGELTDCPMRPVDIPMWRSWRD